MAKRWRLWIGMAALLPVLIIGGFLLYITITDYKPDEVTPLNVQRNQERKLKPGEAFTITTFNIGYAGLDKDQDFFMDGGRQSRSRSEAQTKANMDAIAAFMTEAASDIFLLQEVDIAASRSYHLNEAGYLTGQLPGYGHTFALNYKVPWVPVPLFKPMGSVNSGLLTLAAVHSTSARRLDLPGKESWPRQQLDLDRAYMEIRLPVDNGRELVLVNLHLSAFDEGGRIRQQQLDYLLNYLKTEQKQGNYIILGGDWNHSLPGTDPGAFPASQPWPEWLQKFPDDFRPDGFKWAVDPETPTVRTLDIPYQDGVNFLAIIDGFLVSPNIGVVSVQGHELGFAHSDHNPVSVTLTLE
ncbi:endonuclease [Paenibacillus sp. YSY-4.3]